MAYQLTEEILSVAGGVAKNMLSSGQTFEMFETAGVTLFVRSAEDSTLVERQADPGFLLSELQVDDIVLYVCAA